MTWHHVGGIGTGIIALIFLLGFGATVFLWMKDVKIGEHMGRCIALGISLYVYSSTYDKWIPGPTTPWLKNSGPVLVIAFAVVCVVLAVVNYKKDLEDFLSQGGKVLIAAVLLSLFKLFLWLAEKIYYWT